MGATRFEELEVWRRARLLARRVYRFTGEGAFARDFALRDQIRRAAISVMSNIAEGFERRSRREFAQFLSIARGSVAEVRSQLHLAIDLGYVDAATFDATYDECVQISRMLARLHTVVRRSTTPS